MADTYTRRDSRQLSVAAGEDDCPSLAKIGEGLVRVGRRADEGGQHRRGQAGPRTDQERDPGPPAEMIHPVRMLPIGVVPK